MKNEKTTVTMVVMVEKNKIAVLKEALDILSQQPDFKKLSVVDLIQYLSQKDKVQVVYTKGGWVGVNDLDPSCFNNQLCYVQGCA